MTVAKITVQLEVDTTQLFDTLQKLNGDHTMVSERLIGVLMTGEVPWRDEVGLAVYGIRVMPEAT
jgi:hypothetical protein